MKIILFDAPISLSCGKWHHVATVRRDGETKVFLDGKLTKKGK